MCNMIGTQLFMCQEHVACNQILIRCMGLMCEISVECPVTHSSETKRLRLASTYSPSRKQETKRLERYFVEAWNKDFPWYDNLTLPRGSHDTS